MGTEPVEVLKEERVATVFGDEQAESKCAVTQQYQSGQDQDRSCNELHQGLDIEAPAEDWDF